MEVWKNPFPCTLHKCALKLFCTVIFDLRTCILVPGSWYVLAGSMVLKKPPDCLRNSRTAQVNGEKRPKCACGIFESGLIFCLSVAKFWYKNIG